MKNMLCYLTLISPLFGQLVTPSWRDGGADSHAEWDLFTEAKFAPNFPDVAPDGDATLTCRTSSAFLTSSRNIYSFQAPISMQLDDTTGLLVRNIFLQIGALGSGLDAAGARLITEDEQGEVRVIFPTQSFIASEEELTGDRGGIGTTYGIQWDLQETPITGKYTILFDAVSTSLSIDRVSLDLSEDYRAVNKPKPLSVQVRGGDVMVSWFGNRRLQSSHSLNSGWTDVPETEGVNQIVLPLQKQATFFRLRSAGAVE
ncbi:MAG: hypothetical protein P1U90_18875 [Akkermansiaceae bacterium]|jgi:hypothetical protein|nr:hypothetical protein [Akkermansiaceae bacterium]